jgi:hypothetical protein
MKALSKCCVFIVLLFTVASCAWSQTEVMKGTVIIIGRTKDQVVVAADSRATLKNSHNDDYCKISAFGKNLIFVSAGIRKFDLPGKVPAVWDSYREALIASNNQAKNIQRVAADWGASSAEIIGPSASVNPVKFMRELDTHGTIFTIGVFAGLDPDGGIAATYAKLVIHPAAQAASKVVTYVLQKSVPATSPVQWTIIGEAAIASEFLANKTTRARTGWADWNPDPANSASRENLAVNAAQLVKWTIQYGPPSVGGLVDEIMVDKEGTHWLHRKNACKASE